MIRKGLGTLPGMLIAGTCCTGHEQPDCVRTQRRSPDHHRADQPTGAVRVNGEVVADTAAALCLQEASYPAVQYIPLADVVQDRLIRTETSTYCPFKGEASYYSVTTDAGDIVDDVMWTYENPYPAVAAIAGHVACYPDKAEISIFPG